ncbi:MAG: LysR family transcriptional regulator [Nevskiales bacterium]
MSPRISLEQWRALIAVVEAGGYAQAAEQMNKSQSAVSYAIAKMEELLGTKVFRLEGRKAVLTPTGELLYRRAQRLVDEAAALESAAKALGDECEAEIGIAVDQLFPYELLLRCLERFSQQFPHTRVQLAETVLSANEDALIEGQVDLAITPLVPSGFLGDILLPVNMVAMAHPEHPLHQLGRELDYRDLQTARHIVIRDSGLRVKRDGGWLGAEQRWTVGHMSTRIKALCMGLGFAWLPELSVQAELQAGLLKPLPLREGAQRFTQLHLVYAQPDYAGPAVKALATILHDEVQAAGG